MGPSRKNLRGLYKSRTRNRSLSSKGNYSMKLKSIPSILELEDFLEYIDLSSKQVPTISAEFSTKLYL